MSQDAPDPRHPLPRGLAALLEEPFLWDALEQIALALGAAPLSARRLSDVQRLLEEARTSFGAAGIEIPRLEGVRSYGDLARLRAQLAALGPLDLAAGDVEGAVPARTMMRWVRGAGLILIDLAEEMLRGLAAREIRTELFGIDHGAAHIALGRARTILQDLRLSRAAEDGYPALAQRIAELEAEHPVLGGGVLVAPQRARAAEVRRLAAVLQDLPEGTLERLDPSLPGATRTKVALVVRRGLKRLRDEWGALGAAVGPPSDEAIAAATDPAGADGQELDEEQREARGLPRFFAEIDAHDARPGRQARLRALTVLLWVLAAVHVGGLTYCAAVAFFGVGVDLPPVPTTDDLELARSRIRSRWPLLAVTMAAGLATCLLTMTIARADALEIEISTPEGRTETREGVTPRRRARASAVSAAGCGLLLSLGFPIPVGLMVWWSYVYPFLPGGGMVDARALVVVTIMPFLVLIPVFLLVRASEPFGLDALRARREGAAAEDPAHAEGAGDREPLGEYRPLQRILGLAVEDLDGWSGLLPRWAASLLDERFLWVLLGQGLLALDIPASRVRRLAEVQTVLEEARAALAAVGYEIPRIEKVRRPRDLMRLGARFGALGEVQVADADLERAVPAPVVVGWGRRAGDVLLDLADEALDQLHRKRIRTELVGVDPEGARRLIDSMRDLLVDPALDRAAAEGHAGLHRWLEEVLEAGPDRRRGVEVRPAEPEPGEVDRIAAVLEGVPRETLDGLMPEDALDSRPALVALIDGGLAELRHWWIPVDRRIPSAFDPDLDPAARAAAEEAAAQARADMANRDHERRRRRRYFAEVDASDARFGRRVVLTVQIAVLWLCVSAFVGGQLLLAGTALFGLGLDLPPHPTEDELREAREGFRILWPLFIAAFVTAFLHAPLALHFRGVDENDFGIETTGGEEGRRPMRSALRRARATAARAAWLALLFCWLIPVVTLLLLLSDWLVPWLPATKAADLIGIVLLVVLPIVAVSPFQRDLLG